MPLPIAVLLALLTGLGAGMVNAVGVTFFRIPPIIMTLGTLGVYRGSMRVAHRRQLDRDPFRRASSRSPVTALPRGAVHGVGRRSRW